MSRNQVLLHFYRKGFIHFRKRSNCFFEIIILTDCLFLLSRVRRFYMWRSKNITIVSSLAQITIKYSNTTFTKSLLINKYLLVSSF